MKINLQSFLGDEQQLEDKYRNLYGEGDYQEKIRSYQKKVKRRYLLIGLLFLFTVTYGAITADDSAPNAEIRDGKLISVERPLEGEEPILLHAKIWADSGNLHVGQEKEILIAPRNEVRNEENILRDESEDEKLERRIGTAARSLNQDTSGKEIVFPTELEDGTRLRWEQVEKTSSPMLLSVFMFILFVIFRSRYDGISKEEKSAKESIIHELPEFINKLVLLLNGGIVMQAAMEKIIEDRKKMSRDQRTYFQNQLELIYEKCKATNAPIHSEFYSFAKRSKVQELMRIAGILSDNVTKGADLAVKLQREGEILWFARKKQSEERGRLAETKMTLPLLILLLVLVMITIAPALLEM